MPDNNRSADVIQYAVQLQDVLTTELTLVNLGAADIDPRLEEQLIDGILYAFQVRLEGVLLGWSKPCHL